MQVTLLLPDGSQQTLEVSELRLSLDGSPLELSLETSPTRLRLYSPGSDERWQRFIVHPGAANSMSLEVATNERNGESTAG